MTRRLTYNFGGVFICPVSLSSSLTFFLMKPRGNLYPPTEGGILENKTQKNHTTHPWTDG